MFYRGLVENYGRNIGYNNVLQHISISDIVVTLQLFISCEYSLRIRSSFYC